MKQVGWVLAVAVGAGALEGAARILGRRRTQSRVAPGRALLVYDDDCGVCSRLAMFVEARASQDVELVGFSELPREGVLESLDHAAIRASAHVVTADGVEYHGGESVTRAVRLLRGGLIAAPLDWAALRGLREIGYRLFTWQRGRVSRLTSGQRRSDERDRTPR